MHTYCRIIINSFSRFRRYKVFVESDTVYLYSTHSLPNYCFSKGSILLSYTRQMLPVITHRIYSRGGSLCFPHSLLHSAFRHSAVPPACLCYAACADSFQKPFVHFCSQIPDSTWTVYSYTRSIYHPINLHHPYNHYSAIPYSLNEFLLCIVYGALKQSQIKCTCCITRW